MRWKQLTSIEELDLLTAESTAKTALILKHSHRCNICHVVLDRLERYWKDEDDERLTPYFLDVLAHRGVSNAIAERFGVEHESPQVLLIKNGKCVYTASHSAVSYPDIMAEVK